MFAPVSGKFVLGHEDDLEELEWAGQARRGEALAQGQPSGDGEDKPVRRTQDEVTGRGADRAERAPHTQ